MAETIFFGTAQQKSAEDEIADRMHDSYKDFVTKSVAFIATCEIMRDLFGAKKKDGTDFDRDQYLNESLAITRQTIQDSLERFEASGERSRHIQRLRERYMKRG